mmetsp:Transcript_30940/g.68516  ORF Transcript_30940/g.68516 Transcript_30940/m.68516 type:complete len:166 (+) Transcript_30940:257-754(+)
MPRLSQYLLCRPLHVSLIRHHPCRLPEVVAFIAPRPYVGLHVKCIYTYVRTFYIHDIPSAIMNLMQQPVHAVLSIPLLSEPVTPQHQDALREGPFLLQPTILPALLPAAHSTQPLQHPHVPRSSSGSQRLEPMPYPSTAAAAPATAPLKPGRWAASGLAAACMAA